MAITFIQKAKAASSNNHSAATTGIDTSGATLLLVCLVNYQGAATNTVSDTIGGSPSGNTWVGLTEQANSGNGRVRWYYVNTDSPNVGANHVFSADSTFPTGSYPTIFAYAFNGSHATPYDTPNESGTTADSVDGATGIQPGSVTPSETDCLVVTGIAWYNGPSAPAIDGSFSIPDTELTTTWNIPGGASYWIQTSTTAANPTWTWTGTDHVAVAIAVFRSNAGGGGGGFVAFPKPRGEFGGSHFLTGGLNE